MNYNNDAYKGFVKGNFFDDSYIPYKNYRVQNIVPSNDKDYLLLLIQTYSFASNDLTLYLDTHPDDNNAIALRSDYVNLYNQALNEYEKKYGALNLGSSQLDGYPWKWDVNNWPWEGDK